MLMHISADTVRDIAAMAVACQLAEQPLDQEKSATKEATCRTFPSYQELSEADRLPQKLDCTCFQKS
jgi:hypothetical protein